jgi:hypothetical protein
MSGSAIAGQEGYGRRASHATVVNIFIGNSLGQAGGKYKSAGIKKERVKRGALSGRSGREARELGGWAGEQLSHCGAPG